MSVAPRPGGPPAWLFLALGVVSATAALAFVLRAVALEATLERVISAGAFAVLAAFWLYAWRATRR